VTVSRIQGTFLGYTSGVIFRLDDGTEWQQVGRAEEYVYREQSGCRVFWDGERLYIDVEGTSSVAEVRRYHRLPGL
jgi:hypothetical protein